jgi:hypothetical protein
VLVLVRESRVDKQIKVTLEVLSVTFSKYSKTHGFLRSILLKIVVILGGGSSTTRLGLRRVFSVYKSDRADWSFSSSHAIDGLGKAELPSAAALDFFFVLVLSSLQL